MNRRFGKVPAERRRWASDVTSRRRVPRPRTGEGAAVSEGDGHMGIISYAQNFEDVLLNRVFGGVNYGFYVDVGAGHPVEDSVTKAFYDRGWSGVNVEPGEIFDELAAARPRDINLRMAVYDRSGEIDFVQHPGWYAGLSHVLPAPAPAPLAAVSEPPTTRRRIACDTLANILAVHAARRPIAFLKIDAEGAESAIIASTDWRAIRPTVLVIEATVPLSNQLDNHAWEPLLLQQGYVRTYFDGINCFYVPEERADLLPHFVLPANSLDGFVRHDQQGAELRRQLAEAQDRLARVGGEALEKDRALARLSEQNGIYASLVETLSDLRRQQEAKLAAAEDESARLQDMLGSLSTQLDQARRMAGDAVRLHRLTRELRWPGGPGAVRLVLPLARLIRRLAGTPVPDMLPGEAALAPLTVLADEVMPAVPRPRGWRRRLAMMAYAPIRPLARPLAWRSRSFLTSGIREDLARLEATLQTVLARDGLAGPGSAGVDAVMLRDELNQFGRMLETTLLTLALEREPAPAGQRAVLQAA